MLKSHKIALIAAAMSAVVFLAGTAVLAANTDMKVGFVDTERVYKEAPRMAQLEEEVNALDQLLTKKLKIRAQHLMLTESEIGELVDLQIDAGSKPAAGSRITELTNLDRTRSEEQTTLNESRNLTDKQRTRLKELQDILRKSQQAGEALYNDYLAQMQRKANEIRGEQDAEIRAATDRVREARGLAFVLDRSMVLSGAIEVTSDVISRLDRKG